MSVVAFNRKPQDQAQLLAEVARVCRRAAAGDLEARVLHYAAEAQTAELCDAVNALLDVVDAFVREATASLAHVAAGSFYRRVLPGGLRGEFSRATRAINASIETMGEQAARLQALERRRLELADSFETQVRAVAESVAGASVQMTQSAKSLEQTARESARLGASVAQVSHTVAISVAEVVTGNERLDTCIANIASEVGGSTRQVELAVQEASGAERSVRNLSQAAGRIGDFGKLIATVAEQTKLLALNATIEAARAGTAGKGFGVVAQEVKELARETSGATDRIANQVIEMGEAVSASSSAIRSIGQTVAGIRDASSSIAQALEAQSATTRQIADSLARASESARASEQAAERINGAADQTGLSASELLAAAEELSGQADRLLREVSSFCEAIRS